MTPAHPAWRAAAARDGFVGAVEVCPPGARDEIFGTHRHDQGGSGAADGPAMQRAGCRGEQRRRGGRQRVMLLLRAGCELASRSRPRASGCPTVDGMYTVGAELHRTVPVDAGEPVASSEVRRNWAAASRRPEQRHPRSCTTPSTDHGIATASDSARSSRVSRAVPIERGRPDQRLQPQQVSRMPGARHRWASPRAGSERPSEHAVRGQRIVPAHPAVIASRAPATASRASHPDIIEQRLGVAGSRAGIARCVAEIDTTAACRLLRRTCRRRGTQPGRGRLG